MNATRIGTCPVCVASARLVPLPDEWGCDPDLWCRDCVADGPPPTDDELNAQLASGDALDAAVAEVAALLRRDRR